jgi:hypothetical protein
MEDDLKKNMEEDLKKNGKRPKKKMKETYFFKTRMMTSKKWNTTSKNNLKNGRRPQKKMEDDLKKKGRRPQKKGRQTNQPNWL